MNEDEITITLRKPVEHGGVEHNELTLREPTAGELEKCSSAATSVGQVINLISTIAKVPRKVAESLCQRDLQDASAFFNRFSGDSQNAGATPSQS